jgi:hypothetical protein
MNFAYERKKIKEGIGPEVFDSFKNIDCFLAGGAMTSIYNNKPVEDYDIYCKTNKDAFKVIRVLERERFNCLAKTNRSVLFCQGQEENKILVNVIYFNYFNNLQEVFNLFDFTVCMGGYDFKHNSFDFHSAFFRDNLLKNLFYSNNSKYPIGALVRVGKYKNKGFDISKKELLKIALHCSGLEINNIEELEDQVGTIYGCTLSSFIDTNKPFDVKDVISRLDEIEDQDFMPLIKGISSVDWEAEFPNLFDVVAGPAGEKYYMLDDEFIRKAPQNKTIDRELTFPLYLYKYVSKTETKDLFESFMKSSFKYKLGEEFYAGSHGVYCGSYEKRNSFTYSTERNKVLIKIKVKEPSDFVKFNPLSSTGTRVLRGIVEEAIYE